MSCVAEKTHVDRAQLRTKGVKGVNRDSGVIRGVILAELGAFDNASRGSFNQESFDRILELSEGMSLKSRFTHPNMSNDGLGKFLGRMKDIRQRADRIVGDLHLDKTALELSPNGGTPLGVYVMELAESDPAAFETSFVLSADQVYELDENGERKVGPDGKPLAPVWLPTKLLASDVVDDGDAVHSGFLSSRNTSAWAEQVTNLLDAKFGKLNRQELKDKFEEFTGNYLTHRFGSEGDEGMSDNGKIAASERIDFSEQIAKAVDEKLGPVLDSFSKLSAKIEEQANRADETDRVSKIVALCKEAGCSDKADGFIEEKLSVDKVRESLWAEYLNNRPLPQDAPTELPGGEGGASELNSEEKELQKLWDESPETYQRIGLSREDMSLSMLKSENELVAEDKPLKAGEAYGSLVSI